MLVRFIDNTNSGAEFIGEYVRRLFKVYPMRFGVVEVIEVEVDEETAEVAVTFLINRKTYITIS